MRIPGQPYKGRQLGFIKLSGIHSAGEPSFTPTLGASEGNDSAKAPSPLIFQSRR